MSQEIVNRVVNSYARKCWWVDKDDLLQQAAVVRIEVERAGCPTPQYLRTALNRQLSTYLWGLSSPVTAPKDGRREKLRGVHRAELSACSDDTAYCIENSVALKRALQRVNEKMPHLFEIASQVLLGEKPRDVAAMMGKKQKFVYDACARVRAAIRADLGGDL